MKIKYSRTKLKKVLLSFGIGIYRTPHKRLTWTNPPATQRHQALLSSATYAPWLSDVQFMAAFDAVRQHTLVDIYRAYELWTLASQIHKLDGDILEVGVWQGGSGAILAESAKHCSEKIVYLADTFKGVVKAGSNDPRYKGGEHADTSADLVRRLFSSRALSNYEILIGVFPEDNPDRVRGKIALLHCDVDVYQSAKEVFDWALPRLSVGSIVVFDDYGFSGCEGVAVLCEEISLREDFIFLYNLNGHAVFIRMR